MRKLIPAFLILTAVTSVLRAQVTSTTASQQHDLTFSAGRDFWLAEMSNPGQPSMHIYMTSTKKTKAYIEYPGKTDSIAVSPSEITPYSIPASLQMESSGTSENKGIHIYSKDAPLLIYNLNQTSSISDGEYLIPTIGWGTDYVVAAYESLFQGNGTYPADYPSELTIVSSINNDSVTITPSCDSRIIIWINGKLDTVVQPIGQAFTTILNRGQTYELFPIVATGPDSADLSGTIIHSTKPVGVFAGASQIEIPEGSEYPNHIEDMMPAVRTWGKSYRVPGNYQTPGLYLLIPTAVEQVIDSYDCSSGNDRMIQIPYLYGNQFNGIWDEEYGGQEYSSNQPFLCVKYMYSGTYQNVGGGALESHVNPVGQFVKSIDVVTPNTGDPVYNYLNITVNDADAHKLLLDGQPMTNVSPAQCIGSGWDVISTIVSSTTPHTITGDDSGIDALIYGSGSSMSYMWSSESFEGTFNSPDTTAPIAEIEANCTDATVTFTDTGANASLISAIWIDSLSNATFALDTAFHEGVPVRSDFFRSTVLDRHSAAYLKATAYDLAGNSTTVTLMFAPQNDTIVPPLQNLGVSIGPAPANIAYDTIYNYSDSIFDIDSLALVKGNVGFTLHDSIGGPLDRSPMPPHSRRLVQIQFQAVQSTPVIDSIHFGNACHVMSVAIIGSGGSNDFEVTSQTWVNARLPAPPGGYIKAVDVVSFSSGPITIDNPWWKDQVHFRIAVNQFGDSLTTFPFILPPSPSKVSVSIAYFPDSGSLLHTDTTRGTWESPDLVKADKTIDPRFDFLNGSAIPYLDAVDEQNGNPSSPFVWSLDGSHLSIALPEGWGPPVHLELVNQLGETCYSGTVSGTQIICTGILPHGMYFYRLTSNRHNQTGKLLLGE